MKPASGTRGWAVVSVTALALFVCGAGRWSPPSSRTPDLDFLRVLFITADYDSILREVPPRLRAARASGDSVRAGRLLSICGRTLVTLGRQAEGDSVLTAAIRASEAAGDTLGLLPTLQFKGFVHRDRGEFDPAMAMFERMRDLAHRCGSRGDEAMAVQNLAYRDLRRGELEAARTGYTRVIELLEGENRMDLDAVAHSGMGTLYRYEGDLAAARTAYQRSWSISREIGFRLQEMFALNNLGTVESDAGHMDAAARCYEGALAIAREIRFARGEALAGGNLAQRLVYLGETRRAAEEFERARAVTVRAGFNDMEPFFIISIAWLHFSEGRFRTGAAVARELWERDFVYDEQRQREAGHFLAIALAEIDSVEAGLAVLNQLMSTRSPAPGSSAELAVTLTHAELLWRAGRYADALPVTAAALARARGLGSTDFWVRARLIESACRRALGETGVATLAFHTALDSIDVARRASGGLEWREAYAHGVVPLVVEAAGVLLDPSAGTSTAMRERTLYETLQRVKTRTLLERMHGPDGDSTAVAALAATRAVSLDALQSDILERGELMLDFFAGARATLLFAITRDSLRVVTLPGVRSPLAGQVDVFTDLLSSADPAVRAAYPRPRLDAVSASLGDAILGDVAHEIARARRVVVAPDAFFASIPFATLSVGGAALLDRVEVVQVPSASVFALARADTSGAGEAAAIVTLGGSAAAGIEGARREVEALERRYRHVTRADRLEPGTADAVLHVAAHARASDDSPWQSGLWFDVPAAAESSAMRAAPSPLAAADSAAFASAYGPATVVRAWQIARMRLPYALAVLAACETAGGRASAGEGVLGLTSAFLGAGVPVVVSSLWAVDDHATETLMNAFYERLADGEPVAGALRSAQTRLRDDPDTAHPFYWAGFTVSGDGAHAVRLARTGPVASFPYGVAVAMLLGIVLGSIRFFVRRTRPGTPGGAR